MALITRIARLFHADINAVLDKIEEPESLLKQSIRDMQVSLEADERKIHLSEIELKQLKLKLSELSKSLEETEEQIRLCFKSNKDELVRSLIKRKLENEQAKTYLLQNKEALEDSLAQLKTCFKEQQSLFESIQQKAEIFSQTEESRVPQAWEFTSNSINEDDVEIAFLHEKEKWSAS